MAIDRQRGLEACATLAIFVWGLHARDLDQARSLAFSTLVFAELFRAFAARSPTRLYGEVGAFTNVRLLALVVVSVALQLGIQYLPAARSLFGIGPLSLAHWAVTLIVALVPVTAIEMAKLVQRVSAPRYHAP
jgi:Ca2+-transporting ATPase